MVTKTHNRFYQILVDGANHLCSPKGQIRRHADPEYHLPVIGDRVEVELLPTRRQGVDGYITAILERRNCLTRADAEGRKLRIMAANLDRILFVSAHVRPGIDYGQLDRYMLAAELAGIPYEMIFNKVDLDPECEEDPRLEIYRELDVPILNTSVKTGEGMDAIRTDMADGITFLTGTSGVGKSTLINALVPEADLTTGEVDPRKGRGRHTTTYSVLVPIGDAGYLADSPGLRDFYPPKVRPEEVRFGFREIVAAQAHCRFTSCLHNGEPGCEVVRQVEEDLISDMRYRSYLFILNEMDTYFRERY